jgi:hypothetical protein
MLTPDNKIEPDKPWLSSSDGLRKTFYPLSWNKKNSYAIFSPGIDRFLIVDNYDLWIVYETGKVISSKVSNMVYVLDQDTPEMTNKTCLNFSTFHKKDEKGFGSPGIMTHRQSAALSKIPKDRVVETGWPLDFAQGERKDMLMKLQEYTLFSLRVIYAITLAVNFKNFFPEKEYLDVFFQGQFPEDFKSHYDTTTAEQGMISLIKTILYDANSVDDALASIHNAWLTHSKHDPSGARQTFYKILGIPQPAELAALGPAGFVKDRNSNTLWVV